jgi:hypothetical protein
MPLSNRAAGRRWQRKGETLTMKSIKFSPSVVWISAMVLLTASQVFAEDDVPPIHNPLVWVERLAAFFHDLLQLGLRLVG